MSDDLVTAQWRVWRGSWFPGLAHHVTPRGNCRERVFFSDEDYSAYLGLISATMQVSGTAIWAYCLMPNHVHFIIAPAHEDGLRATFAEAHRRYTARIHAREKWPGISGRAGSAPPAWTNGAEDWIKSLEVNLGLQLAPARRGSKLRPKSNGAQGSLLRKCHRNPQTGRLRESAANHDQWTRWMQRRWTLVDCEVVGRVGIEPTTTRLKVGCSTAELPARGGRA